MTIRREAIMITVGISKWATETMSWSKIFAVTAIPTLKVPANWKGSREEEPGIAILWHRGYPTWK